MRLLVAAGIFACTVASAAVAQSSQAQVPAQNGPTNSAVDTTGENKSPAPVAGANSFTESQAIARIKAKGFTDVSHLVKDNNGIWRGTAVKDGQNVGVTVDFEGNVNPA
jgi:hypothetical protein